MHRFFTSLDILQPMSTENQLNLEGRVALIAPHNHSRMAVGQSWQARIT